MRRSGGARGLVLAGSAGVGKTRLAREALAVAESKGLAVHWAVATASARDVPLGAFASLLTGGDGAPLQLLQNSVAALAARGRAGVLLGVDDAHLLDGPSAALLHQLVLQHSVTVVVTVRSGEPAPDAVTALWKDGHLPRLEVQPLSRAETATLLESVLGGPVASATATRLWTLTQGNVLYLRQLVDDALRTGALSTARGMWRLRGGTRVPPGLAELVAARMGALPEPVGKVLDLLALAEPLPVATLSSLAGAEAVEEAEARALVQVEPDEGRVQARLAHPLYGEARRRDIGTLRARRLGGEIVRALSDAGEPGSASAFRRAVLSLESDVEVEPEVLTAAARHAAWLLDLPLAGRLARAAVAAGGGFAAQQVLAYVVSVDDRDGATARETRRLAELAESDLERTSVAWVQASGLFWGLRRPAEAEAVLNAALPGLSDPVARAVVTGMRSSFASLLGRPHEGITLAREALAVPGLPDASVALCALGLGTGLGLIGQADRVDELAARGYAAAARSFEASFLRYPLANMHRHGLWLAGYIDRAARVAEDFRAASGDTPGTSHLYCVALDGPAAFASGRLDAAIGLLREVYARGDDRTMTALRYGCQLSLTTALAMAGRANEARDALADLERGPHPSFRMLDPELELARAWVAAAEGALSEAVTRSRAAAETAASCEHLAQEVLALQTAVRFGDRTVADRLTTLAATVDGPRAPTAAAHAAALAAGDGDALSAAAHRWEQIGDKTTAADAAAQAAVEYRAQGLTGSAATAAAMAHRLAEACGASTPATRAAAQPLPLTEREREIVTLAADGLSNREIADRLVVSVRTVEGHIYRASAKLGVTSRIQLADRLTAS